MTSSRTITFLGTARTAGSKVVHTILADDEAIKTRVSAHRYNYAFVKRTGPGTYAVTRWSRNSATRGSEILVNIRNID